MPWKIPNIGKDNIAIIEYRATDAPPNIIGPAAPIGTDGPCEIQSATILVRNMAGKTVARPAIKGYPRPDIQTAIPIANAAIIPLESKTYMFTLFLLEGVGPICQHIVIPRIATNSKPINPIIKGGMPAILAKLIKFNIIKPQNNHINNDIKIIIIFD